VGTGGLTGTQGDKGLKGKKGPAGPSGVSCYSHDVVIIDDTLQYILLLQERWLQVVSYTLM